MTEAVKIRVSIGLVALAFSVAIIHAAAVGVMAMSLHKPVVEQQASWQREPASPRTPYGEITSFSEPMTAPPTVDLDAQREIKQAGGICLPCQPQQHRQPIYINGERVVHIGPVTKPTTVNPAVYSPPIQPLAIPDALAQPASAAVPTPPKKKYQVALFLDSTPQSQQLLSWFGSHKELSTLKEQSEFQTYTSSNPLYRTRYADIVPANQFPVVLVTDATGGHIHAAGRTMIPGSGEELWSDVLAAAQLWRQAKEGKVITGLVKTKGYSWDDQILPSMQLQASDCPDGLCFPEQPWRPGDRLRPNGGGGLFDLPIPSQTAFLWANASEIATVALLGLAALLLMFILGKRGL